MERDRQEEEEGRNMNGEENRRERERREERKKEKPALGSRDLVWYPTPPWCALACTHILGTPPYGMRWEDRREMDRARRWEERERERKKLVGHIQVQTGVFVHSLLPNLMSKPPSTCQ